MKLKDEKSVVEFEENSIYMYSGHGNGYQFIKENFQNITKSIDN